MIQRLVGLLCAGFIALAAQIASTDAQTIRRNDDAFRSTSKSKSRAIGRRPLGELGIVVGDGVVLMPSITIEGGHDGNPDQQFVEEDSTFGLAAAGLGIAIVRPYGATVLSVSGTGLRYGELTREDRWAGTVSGDTYYVINPNVSVSVGGFFRHDELDSSKDETASGFANLKYADAANEAFIKGRIIEVRYLNPDVFPSNVTPALFPFFRTSTFNAQRRELSIGALFGRNRVLALYGELGLADVDYINQANEAAFDRDADDYYAVFGIRVQFSPYLRGEFGYRFNRRDLEDPLISSVNNSYFDGRLVWAPSAHFNMTFEIDRTFGEPSSTFGRVADVTRYAVSADYRPSAAWLLSIYAHDRRSIEIGEVFRFRERRIAGKLTHHLNNKVDIYAAILGERYSDEFTQQEYDRLRVTLGTSIRFADVATKSIEGLGGLFGHGVSGPLKVWLGYTHLDLPETQMLTLVGGTFFDRVVGKITDHDGDLKGGRIDAELTGFASHDLWWGYQGVFNLGGFYAYADSTDHSACRFTNRVDCAYVNILDFDHTKENNTGAFGTLEARTKREVDYWGLSVSATLSSYNSISLKDEPDLLPTPFSIGIAMRALQQNVHLFAVDVAVPDPVDYDEGLDTYYWGAFVGYDRTFKLGHGLSVTLDADAGVYYAYSEYDGRYKAFIPIGNNVFLLEQARQTLSDDEIAFIGSLRVGVSKDVGWGTLGVFAQGEYLSYVPKVNYNDRDRAGGSPFGLVGGTNDGTSLGSDDMFTYTIGGSLKVPLN